MYYIPNTSQYQALSIFKSFLKIKNIVFTFKIYFNLFKSTMTHVIDDIIMDIFSPTRLLLLLVVAVIHSLCSISCRRRGDCCRNCCRICSGCCSFSCRIFSGCCSCGFVGTCASFITPNLTKRLEEMPYRSKKEIHSWNPL